MILAIDEPHHAIGQPNVEYATQCYDTLGFTTGSPAYTEVLNARARVESSRVAIVRDFVTIVTSDELAATRKNSWVPDRRETALSCRHVLSIKGKCRVPV